MVVPDERLVLESSVIDDFSDTLTELATQLSTIDALAERTVENIEADADIASAMAELETLEQQIDRVDDDLTVGGGLTASGGVTADGGGGGATADGGGSPDPLSLADIENAQQALGEAFDPSALLDDRDVQRYADLFEDGLQEHLDADEAFSAIVDDDNPLTLDALQNAFTMGDGGLRGVAELDRAGVLDLPEESKMLRERFSDLELKMGDFFQIFASLIPLIAVFVGALPAVIGGLVSLGAAAVAAAGALAGVAGLALLGSVIEDGQLNASSLRNTLRDLLDTFIEEFEPVTEMFSGVAADSVRTIESLIRGLASEADILLSVTDEFRRALDFIERNAPGTLAAVVAFGEAAMPILGGIIREIGNLELLSSFATMINQSIGLLSLLGGFIFDMLGPIFQLSRGFLLVATAITGFITAILTLADAVPLLLPGLGVLLALSLSLVSVFAVYSVVTKAAAAATFVLSGAVGNALLAKIKGAIMGIHSYIASVTSATVATIALTAAVSFLVGVLTFGLAPVLGSLTTGFNDLSGDIDSATSSLRQFTRASRTGNFGSVGTGGGLGVGGGGSYANANQLTVVAPDKQTGNAVANTLSFDGTTPTEQQVSDRTHTR